MVCDEVASWISYISDDSDGVLSLAEVTPHMSLCGKPCWVDQSLPTTHQYPAVLIRRGNGVHAPCNGL